MQAETLIAAISAESRALRAAAAAAPAAAVDACPGWSIRDLIVHVGVVQGWAAAIVSAGERVSQKDIVRPADDATDEQVAQWAEQVTADLCDVLGRADPDSLTWTFARSGDSRVWWWMRRQALETAVHRWDTEQAAWSRAEVVETDLALEGLHEYLHDFLPNAVDRNSFEPLDATLHLHATDAAADSASGPTSLGEWLVDLSTTPPLVSAGHAKATTAIRGSASDLLLFVWNRLPATSDRLEVFGDASVAGAWAKLPF